MERRKPFKSEINKLDSEIKQRRIKVNRLTEQERREENKKRKAQNLPLIKRPVSKPRPKSYSTTERMVDEVLERPVPKVYEDDLDSDDLFGSESDNEEPPGIAESESEEEGDEEKEARLFAKANWKLSKYLNAYGDFEARKFKRREKRASIVEQPEEIFKESSYLQLKKNPGLFTKGLEKKDKYKTPSSESNRTIKSNLNEYKDKKHKIVRIEK